MVVATSLKLLAMTMKAALLPLARQPMIIRNLAI
jgi:hypothetical protein